MLEGACRHFSTIPVEGCCFCNSSAPEKLLDICVNYINKNRWLICEFTGNGHLKLKDGISLPVEICEKFLAIQSGSFDSLDSCFINIFKDTCNTRLKKVYLRKSKISDQDLAVLLSHKLLELELALNEELTRNSIRHIKTYGSSLVSLSIEDANMFPVSVVRKMSQSGQSSIFETPNLRRFTLKGCQGLPAQFYQLLLKSMTNLVYLDLSSCGFLYNFSYSKHLIHLHSLILYNVDNIDLMVPVICELKNLSRLDMSQSREEPIKFPKPEAMLTALVDSLPNLISLDISGTNLAGKESSNIPGLALRVHNPLHFLGLYDTLHDACSRQDIPAKLVAGNANEEQILISALSYIDRKEMIQKVLDELFNLLHSKRCQFVGQALKFVLEAMDRHLDEIDLQKTGSAILLDIVKSKDIELCDAVHVKRKIISTLINSMSCHHSDKTIMRNGCHTLDHFDIPQDVIFDYQTLVVSLLKCVFWMKSESSPRRIGTLHLLGHISSAVEQHQKLRLGELGVINKMLWLIAKKLDKDNCDAVLETAWLILWNITDEIPPNCRKFLENNGMESFLSCVETFPHEDYLLINMMGLLGNVSEVKELRCYLITPKCLSVFSDLLESRSRDIEVSYNAAGIISHIASDGPEAWTVDEPSRQHVLNKMVRTIDKWNLKSQTFINYRSFKPILYLVRIYHTPECQRWAVWALANLTSVYPEKYCHLVEQEGGLDLLRELIAHPDPPVAIKDLAAIVIENCSKCKNHLQ